MRTSVNKSALSGRVAIVSLVLLLWAGDAAAQIQQAWALHNDNGIPNGQHQALRMQLGTDGDIYICGFSQNANSNLDYAVLKYSPSGNLLWTARLDTTNNPQALPKAFALDPANDSVVTGSAGTVSFDGAGNQRWFAPYAGNGVACDTASNTFVTGFGTNFNTVKLNAGGSNLWQTTYKDVGPTVGEAVIADTNGNVYVAGSDVYMYYSNGEFGGYYAGMLVVKFSPNGAQQWTAGAIGNSTGATVAGMQVGVSNNIYVSGHLFPLENENAFFVLCLNQAGGAVWDASNPTDNLSSQPRGIALVGPNDVLVTGQDASAPNCAYATYRISTNGAYEWGSYYPHKPTFSNPSSAINIPTAIASDKSGIAYVTGYSPTSATSNDIVTIAYDTNGKQLWLERYDGPAHGDDEGNAICVDTNGNVYVAGYDTPIGGGTEMVLIKYSPVTVQHEANGDFQLEAQGAPSEPFDIQASTNLATWLDLGDFAADTNGLLQFTDTNAGLYPSRFYQAIPR